MTSLGQEISRWVPESIRSAVFKEQGVIQWADEQKKQLTDSKDLRHIETAVTERRLAKEAAIQLPAAAAEYLAATDCLTLEQYGAQVTEYQAKERALFEAQKSKDGGAAFWPFMLLMTSGGDSPTAQDKIGNDMVCLARGLHPGAGMTCF